MMAWQIIEVTTDEIYLDNRPCFLNNIFIRISTGSYVLKSNIIPLMKD